MILRRCQVLSPGPKADFKKRLQAYFVLTQALNPKQIKVFKVPIISGITRILFLIKIGIYQAAF